MKTEIKKKKIKKKSIISSVGKYKFAILGCVLLVLLTVLIADRFNPNKLLGNLYTLEELESNIDNVKAGDTVNYEINGYSDWQVLYVDKKNNTVDVVSKTSPEKLKFEGNEGLDSYLTTLQNKANQFVDGNVAIKARSITKADLDNFTFDEELWIANVYDNKVATTSNRYLLAENYGYSENYMDNMYFSYWIRIQKPDTSKWYDQGEEVNVNINGVSEWITRWDNGDSIVVIPKDFIKVDKNKIKEMNYDINTYFDSLLNKFNDSRVYEKNRLYEYELNDSLSDEWRSYYANKYKDSALVRDYNTRNETETNYKQKGYYISFSYVRGNRFECCRSTEHYERVYNYSFGYRPVVTLKFSNKETNGKALNTDLKIGDNVNYQANGYQNWKVLSIDKKNNTVDIISGGIVKNITLKGKEGYENFESKASQIVDEYKTDKVLESRLVNSSDLDQLNKINDAVTSKYWTDNKKAYNKKYSETTSSNYNAIATRVVGIMYFDSETYSNKKDWVTLSGEVASGPSMSGSNYEEGNYTAGIRPVLTLKLEQVKKVDEKTKQQIINKSKTNDAKIKKEQQSNVNYFSGGASSNSNSTSSQNNTKQNSKSTENESEPSGIKSEDGSNESIQPGTEIVERSREDDGNFKKFVVISIITIIVIFIINTLIVALILWKLNSFKKLKK